MANLWPLVGGTNRLLADARQDFFGFGGNARRKVEAEVQQEMRDTYTASNLRVYLSVWINTNVVFVFRLNTADGNQTITATGTGEFEDTANTDSLVSGDLICLDGDQSAGGHGDDYHLTTFQTTLDASTDVPFICSSSFGTSQGWSISGGTTEYGALPGDLFERAVVADVEYTMRATRTLRDLRVFCNSFNNNTTVTVQKNQVDDSLTVTATGTGEFLDTSNTDSFVAGDEVNYEATSSGTMDSTIFSILAVEGNTPTTVQMYSSLAVASSAAFFIPSGIDDTATEAETEIEAEGIATIQNLFVNCITNAETRTIRTRKNQANGAASISVTGTGLFEDTVNTDTLAAEDDLSIQQDAGSSGTNDYLIAVEWDGAVAAAVTIPARVMVY